MPEQKDLSGRRIVLTRPRDQTAEWRKLLEARGAEVLALPLIEVTKHYDKNTLVEVFAELGQYEWLVFTSANGARFFFEEFRKGFDDIRALGLVRIAVVGDATAAVVRAHHLRVDLQPAKANAEELAQMMMEREAMDSAKVLVVTGNLNRDVLVEKLNFAHAIVDRLPLYQTEPVDLSAEPAAIDYRAKGADAVLFASPSAAQSFADQSDALKLSVKARVPLFGSIGPTTTAAMKELGLPVAFEATEPSLDSLVATLLPRLK